MVRVREASLIHRQTEQASGIDKCERFIQRHVTERADKRKGKLSFANGKMDRLPKVIT